MTLLAGPKKRLPQLDQAYSTLFYQERIKPRVESEMRRTAPATPETKAEHSARSLRTIKLLTKQMFEQEDEETIEKVNAYRKTLEEEESGADAGDIFQYVLGIATVPRTLIDLQDAR